MKKILLVGTWNVDNGWYGDKYRVILRKDDESAFLTKTETIKYKGALSKYIKAKYNVQIRSGALIADESESFKEYTYCANGPSLSYTHFYITVSDLEKYMAKKAK